MARVEGRENGLGFRVTLRQRAMAAQHSVEFCLKLVSVTVLKMETSIDPKPTAPQQVGWAELREEYWDAPGELLSLVESSEDLRSVIQGTLNAALESYADWPAELRRWQVVLIAAIELDIASIWDPRIRTAVHANLLSKARDWGVTPAAVRMVSGEIGSICQALREMQVEAPAGWNRPPRNTK